MPYLALQPLPSAGRQKWWDDKRLTIGSSLAVQWLRLHGPNAGGMGSIPDLGTEISHAMQPKKERKKKGKACPFKATQYFLFVFSIYSLFQIV